MDFFTNIMKLAKNRYLHFLDQFSKAVKAAIKEHRADQKLHPAILLHAKDGRTPCFMLQALSRIDSKISRHADLAEIWLDEYKSLEDGLGKIDYWVAYSEQNNQWKFPAAIQSYFITQQNIAAGVMEERLIKHGWMTKELDGSFQYSNQAIERFNKQAQKADWFKSKKEQQKLLSFFEDEVLEIQEKLESKEIDLNKLEEGVHELRRKFRWLAIYSVALQGKIAIGKSSKEGALSEFVTPERLALPFNQLPKNKAEEDLIYFLPGAYFVMSDVISSIGDIKDPGLATEEFEKIGPWFGLNHNQIKRHLGKDFKTHQKVVSETKNLIQKYIIDEQLLMHMAAYFKNQIK